MAVEGTVAARTSGKLQTSRIESRSKQPSGDGGGILAETLPADGEIGHPHALSPGFPVALATEYPFCFSASARSYR